MNINKNIENNLIKFLYAIIKINKQDINKCNVLFSSSFSFNKTCLLKKLNNDLTLINFKNDSKKLKNKTILKAFNFEIVNNLSTKKLKNFTMLGNFDIGVLLLKKEEYFFKLCAGNGFMLSYQKKQEFINALKEFDKISYLQLIKFFKTECKKKNIKPLNLTEIIYRKKEIIFINKSIKI